MYYEYTEIVTAEGVRRFHYFGAAQQYARELGKAGTPYNWNRYGRFHDPRPLASMRGGAVERTYDLGSLNGIYGHERMS